MATLDDDRLDAYLAADELPRPPEELVRRALRSARDAAGGEPAAEPWLARLARVREQFRQLLAQPEFARMALATRGGDRVGGVLAEADAALGHAVQGRNIRGQIFLTDLESPADLPVELREANGDVIEETRADDIGRFRFLGLEPGEYRLRVPELDLEQSVEIRS